MCGIVASFQPTPWGAPEIEAALGALRHRGPDGQGSYRSPCGRAQLGHTRLALVDREGGRQPVVSEDGRVVAVVNGEFYGDDALRASLAARGHRFRGRSDSELLVHLYEERGADALDSLRGEFAFILWDDREKTLFAARDRFGIKPLFYARLPGGGLLLASEARALFALGAPRRWDHEAFWQAASMQYLLPGATLFEGVRALPPASLLQASGGRVDERRYWNLDYPTEGDPALLSSGDDEAADELRKRLDEAVALRLRGDEPAAFQLSGGIDSASVVASACAALGRPVDAFTVSFGGDYDEAAQAAEIANYTGARLHVVDASSERLAEAFGAAVEAGEGLAINGHIAGKYLLMQAIRGAGYKVALTGEGADEVLAGYAHLRADLAGSAEALAGSNAASAGLMLPEGESLPLDAVEQAMGFVPTWLAAKGGLGLRVRELLRDELRERFASVDPARRLIEAFDVRGQLAGRGRVEQSLWLWTHLAMSGYIVRTLGDAQEMAHGVEGRLPFLDHRLFEWLRGLPLGLKIREGVEKFVLRRAQRGRLPEAALGRQKHPFVAPPLSGRMAELANDTLRGAAMARSPFFDPARVRARLDALPTLSPRERKTIDPALYLTLSSVVLQERLGLAEG